MLKKDPSPGSNDVSERPQPARPTLDSRWHGHDPRFCHDRSCRCGYSTPKTRKPSRQIVEISEVVPLRKIDTDWIVDFADDPERDYKSLASITLLTTHLGTVTAIVHTCKPDLLSALSDRSQELRASNGKLRSHVRDNRFILDRCGPSDVLALAQVVARIEKRELAEVKTASRNP